MNRATWLEWRKKGLGASDSPIIMGVSPWMTRYDLWMQKTGQKITKDGVNSNWAIDRGNRLEPLARAHYELMVGFSAPAILCEHPKYPFIRASLDGYNAENQIVLEIKCPGRVDHDKAMRGKIPMKYYPQVQHQLFVSNAKKADYFSFDGHNGVIVEVTPDPIYIAWMLGELIKFWEAINLKIPPEPINHVVVPSGIAE
jgi:putative phage-type endonuclease